MSDSPSTGDKVENRSFRSSMLLNIFLTCFSGVLLFLSFPKHGSGIFAWMALVPLFFALRGAESPWKGFFFGFLTGLTGYIGITYWIIYVIIHYGGLPWHVGLAIMVILASYLSLYVAFFACSVVSCRGKASLSWTAPVLWVCFEYGKSFLLTGFPWENLGYSQYQNTYLVQFADVGGVFGLSFLIVFVNAAIFEFLEKRSKQAYGRLGAAFLVLIAVYTYGYFRFEQIRQALKQMPDVEVSLLQGNIDQSVKWDKNYKQETLNIYEQLTLKNFPKEGSLIVWPETALPFKFQSQNDLHDQLIRLVQRVKGWFIFGSIRSDESWDGKKIYNSAYFLSPSGDVKGRYDKVHLVPYGEYVPLRKMMPFIEGFTQGIGDFTPGKRYEPLDWDGRKIGVLICYEGILPSAAREYKNRQAELLVSITNDAWFGATSAPFQHFSMTVFRAVETRLYLVRAANTGISGIVDPTGKIVAQTGIFQPAALKGTVKFVSIPTLYARYGDMGIGVCLGIVVIYLLILTRRRKKCR